MKALEVDAPFEKTRYKERRVPFRAGDGVRGQLTQLQGPQKPSRGPVMLVHGAGVRSNIFRPPVRQTLVDMLVAHGYDVWLEDWRASINLLPTPWTLDEAARYDHPAAVKKIVEETGWSEVKAIIHCQGSTSFTMSALAGLVPEVKTIVSNAVSLHPVVPHWSSFKINWAIPLVKQFSAYLNPQWGRHAPTPFAKAINGLVKLTHHECTNNVCRQVSFTYGSGTPALWRHENLNDATHTWLEDEFAAVPIRFYEQMRACLRAGHLVSLGDVEGLPHDFTTTPLQTDARFALFAGAHNRCFLPESQARTFHFLNRLRPDYHTFHLLPDYSHLDVFMGKHAWRDVFPLMLQELEK